MTSGLITVSGVVDIYDSTTEKWSAATLSQARSGLAAASVGSLVFFTGGSNGTSSYSSVVDIYDDNTGLWSSASILSQARSGLVAATVGSKVLFGGGVTINGTASNIVDIYDDSTGLWSTAALSQARRSLAAASVGTKVLFGGGNSGTLYSNNGTYSNVVDIYFGSTGLWNTAILVQGRSSLAAASVSNQVLFGGGLGSSIVDIYTDLAIPTTTTFASATPSAYTTTTSTLSPTCTGATPTAEFACKSGVWVANTSISLPVMQIEVSTLWNITGDLDAQNGSILTILVQGSGPVIHVSGTPFLFAACLPTHR